MPEPVKKKTCFVIMPFGALKTDEHRKNLAVYNLIKKTAEEFDYFVHRADESDIIGNIIRGIMENLLAADLVIADLSFWNVNVFYELGVRHVLKCKGTIPVYRMVKEPPFDIRNYRAIPFSMDSDDDKKAFQEQLRRKIQYFEQSKSKKADNPVHEFIGEQLKDGIDPACYQKVVNQIEVLKREKTKLAQQLAKANTVAKKTAMEYRPSIEALEEQKVKMEQQLAPAMEKTVSEKAKPDQSKASPILPEFISFGGGRYQVREFGKTGIINPFEMSIYPVTNYQYEQFDPEHKRNFFSNHDDQPVIRVSWLDIKEYLEWLSKKTGERYWVPTKAEWEFAASGGGKRKYPWGDERPSRNRANYKETSLNRTSDVNHFSQGATPEGLFDMAGNVWELCADQSPLSSEHYFLVLRGGAFNSKAEVLRCVHSGRKVYKFCDDTVGFRLVRHRSF